MKQLALRLALLALLLVGCGVTTTDGTQPAPEQTSTSSAPTTTTTLATVDSLTTSTSAEPEISIVGDDVFVEHTETALALLADEASQAYTQVADYIDTISFVAEGSGMDVFSRTFLTGEQTAYAPGFESDEQVVWFASTIVHDSCHSRLYSSRAVYTGREAELECLADQLDALETLDLSPHFEDYVSGLIEGVDDPGNDYWNDPDRHW